MEKGLVFGLSIGELLTIYDHDSRSWKMSECLFTGDYARYSAALPKSGMMRNGKIYAQATWVRRTKGKESGLLLIPTPQAIDGSGQGREPRLKKDCNRNPNTPGSWRADLKDYALKFPTPRANDAEKRGKIANDPRNGLPAAVMWPTPHTGLCHHGGQGLKASLRRKELGKQVGLDSAVLIDAGTSAHGQLNPTWVDWLMGYPIGWTDSADSETRLSLK